MHRLRGVRPRVSRGSDLPPGQPARGPEGVHRVECRDGHAVPGDYGKERASGGTLGQRRSSDIPAPSMSCRKIAWLSLFAAALLAVAGCGGSGSGKDALIYAQSDDPKTLDPINTDIAEAVHVITNVFDTLV